MKIFRILLLLLCTSVPLFGLTDNELLLQLEQLGCNYFWNEASPSTGLVRDKANNDPYASGTSLASISTTGFGLTALCIAHSRKWLSYNDVYNRILTTLNYFNNGSVSGYNGFYFHFIDINSGTRSDPGSELSSIDTSLFIAGALFAAQYFKGTQIETVANQLYQKINWQWLCNSGDFVSMGWKPESYPTAGGFTIPYAGGNLCSYLWSNYNEGMLLDFLAIGSSAYPPNNSPNCWTHMTNRRGNFAGYSLITTDPQNSLFVHLYPQCWLDLRKMTYMRNSTNINYYTNSKNAILVNRIFTSTNKNPIRKTDFWGASASEGPGAGVYQAYGAPPGLHYTNDGTITPIAAGASVMITPNESIRCLKFMYTNYQNFTYGVNLFYGQYGFSDFINKRVNQCGGSVIGIDEGAIVLSLENYATGLVWDVFMQLPSIKSAIDQMGFNKGSDSFYYRPSTVSDLVYSYDKLTWTAPSDNSGNVKKYYMKYSKTQIINMAQWNDAIDIPNSLVPQAAGASEILIADFIPEGDYYFAIRSEDADGNKSLISGTSEKKHTSAQADTLFPNYPNPAKDSTTIRYQLNGVADITFRLYGLSGNLLKEWVLPNSSSGYHEFVWDLKDKNNKLLTPGIYQLILEKGNRKIQETKVVVIR